MFELNGYPVPVTVFPDKTSQVWRLHPKAFYAKQTNHIRWVFESEAEVFQLVQLVHLTRELSNKFSIELEIQYLPYARQDKAINNTSTFALRSFAWLLNGLVFKAVKTIDVHSSVANETIPPLVDYTGVSRMKEVASIVGAKTILYPDEGAHTRYAGVFKEYETVIGSKIRDPETGYIESYTLNAVNVTPPVLVVDDICDGGATFIMAANRLISRGVPVRHIHLYVSHGIFSKGTDCLFDHGFERIFTYDREVSNKTVQT